MPDLLALDIALLPPPDVARLAIALSRSLPADAFKGLVLDDAHLPHVTLAQLFVGLDELEHALARVDEIVRPAPPLRLRVTGGTTSGGTVWMAVEPHAALTALHERIMHALRVYERPHGGRSAFHGGDARPADVLWVARYRTASSFEAFVPHITLGHAAEAPVIEPFDFEAATVAACHLGRFCTCRYVIRAWTLA